MHSIVVLRSLPWLLLPVSLLAQGALTPPGAPAPSMKTLDQIEARTLLSQASLDASGVGYITINHPGSYYLTSNLAMTATSACAIMITAPNVTLDLNGFTIGTAANPTSGSISILITPPVGVPAAVTIRNGVIVGPRVRAAGANPWEATFAGPTVATYGIYCVRAGSTWGSNHFILENLIVRGHTLGIALNTDGAEDTGGRATIRHCQVVDNDGRGVSGRYLDITDLVVSGCSGDGVRIESSTLERFVVERCGGDGVNATLSTVRGGVVRNTGGTGVVLANNSRAEDVIASAGLRGFAGASCTLSGVAAVNNRGHGFELTSAVVTGFKAFGNLGAGVSGNNNVLTDGQVRANSGHGIYSPQSSVRGVVAESNVGAGVYCDDASISGCVARANGDDGIRAVNSVLSDCRAFGNDTTPGGYNAQGIYWTGGKAANCLADTATPALP